MLMDLERYVAWIMDRLIPGDVCPEKLFQQAGQMPGWPVPTGTVRALVWSSSLCSLARSTGLPATHSFTFCLPLIDMGFPHLVCVPFGKPADLALETANLPLGCRTDPDHS